MLVDVQYNGEHFTYRGELETYLHKHHPTNMRGTKDVSYYERMINTHGFYLLINDVPYNDSYVYGHPLSNIESASDIPSFSKNSNMMGIAEILITKCEE